MPATHNFSDIFISYSRRNLTFVKKLEKALRQHHLVHEIWVDWEDIPESSDWRAEILAGIEGSNTFLFVITPDSVVSAECRVEIEHAVETQKRIVPVVHIEVTDPEIQKQIHPAIRRHNWFFIRDKDDFEERLEALIQVIMTDQYHVNHHTRFLVRSSEWLNNDRENSYLLSGLEIDIAERWLSEAEEEAKDPIPTDVQRDYIAASRRIDNEAKAEVARREETIKRSQRATRFLMIFLIAAFIAIIVSSLLIMKATRETQAANATNTQSYYSIVTADTQIEAANEQIATAGTQIQVAHEQSTEAAVNLQDVEADSYDYRMIGQALLNQIFENDALAYAYEAIGNTDPPVEILPVFYEIASRSQNRMTLFGYPSGASQVAFSPDGTLLATIGCRTLDENGISCLQNELNLWNVTSGELVHTLMPESNPLVIAFSPNANILASGHENGNIIFWDARTGESLFTGIGHNQQVISIAFNVDGTRLASSGFDNTIRVWAIEGNRFAQIVHVNGAVNEVSLAFSRDSSMLASASIDGIIRIRGALNGREQYRLEGHESWVSSVAFSPDGTQLVSSSFDNTLRLWNLQTEATRILRGHDDWVSDVAFSPDGDFIASSSFDGTIRVWDAESGTEIVTLRGHESWVMSIIFSPDGEMLASASYDGTVRLWDTTGAAERRNLIEHTGDVTSVAFAPDSVILASGSQDNTVRIWDVTNGQLLATLRHHLDRITTVAVSPDGRYVASASTDDRIIVWDILNGEQWQDRSTFTHSDDVLDLIFSSDSSMLISASADTTFRIWDVATGDVRTVNNPGGAVTAVTINRDDTIIATGSVDNELRLWDLSTGEVITVLSGHEAAISALAYNRAGTLLASASQDGQILLWDLSGDGDVVPLEFIGHLDAVVGLSFSVDDTTLASASLDDTLRLWDVATGLSLLTIEAGEGNVNGVDFSPDGTTLASAHSSGVIKLWNIGSLSFMRQWVQENRYVREFSCPQRNDFGIRVPCDDDDAFPTRTPYPTSSPIVVPTLQRIWTPQPTSRPRNSQVIFTPFWIPTNTPFPTLTPVPEVTEEASEGDSG